MSESEGIGIETGSGAITRLKCDGPDGCDDGCFEYKGSLASKLISVACCGCGAIRKVSGPVEVISATGERKILEWHEDDVQKRVALEGETPEDRKRVAFTLPKSVHARFMYARKLFAFENGGNASTAKYFEMACEEYIQAHEHLVPVEMRGVVPPLPGDEAAQTELPLDADDALLPVADGELVDDGADGLEFEDESDPSVDAPAIPDPGEYRADAASDETTDSDDEPLDIGDSTIDPPDPTEPVAETKPSKGWQPRVVSEDEMSASEGQPVNAREVERVAELDQETNETLVKIAKGMGLVATPRMPKRLLVRMIVNAEFPHADGLVQ